MNFRCEFERLENVFKYAENIETASGLLYLTFLHNVVKKQIEAQIKDDRPLDEEIYRLVNRVVRCYKENEKIDVGVFPKLPQSQLDKIKIVSIITFLTEINP